MLWRNPAAKRRPPGLIEPCIPTRVYRPPVGLRVVLARTTRETLMHDHQQPDESPVMEPFPDKSGAGWHVLIRYPAGHERLIEGFATRDEAVEWIVANTGELHE